MRHLYSLILFVCCLFTKGAAFASEPTTEYANKVFLRFGSGYISNVGTSKGSTFTYGGANIGIAYFLSNDIAAGLSYKVETTFSSIPLKGLDIFTRYYFLGTGTKIKSVDSNQNRIVSHSDYSLYSGMEFSNRVFSFEIVENEIETGTISATNLILGIDYRLKNNWELNTEVSYTLFPFGGDDPRVRIKWILLSIGSSYVF